MYYILNKVVILDDEDLDNHKKCEATLSLDLRLKEIILSVQILKIDGLYLTLIKLLLQLQRWTVSGLWVTLGKG